MRKLNIVPPAEKEPSPLLRPSNLAHRHLISLHDLTPLEIDFLLKLAQAVKANPERYHNALEGSSLAMILEKPSLRARVTFDLGISQLGGRALCLSSDEVGLGEREAVKDVARNLSG
jgi:ornithine carbamoyltransferase